MFPFLCSRLSAPPEGPAWWYDESQEFSGEGASVLLIGDVDHSAVANVGQGKWLALQAVEALSLFDPAVGPEARALLIPGVFEVREPLPEELPLNYAPLLLGQLKAMAKPIYDTLNSAYNGENRSWVSEQLAAFNVTSYQASQLDVDNFGYVLDGYYPWNPADTVSQTNIQPSNLGQLKAVFTLDFSSWPVRER